jgi:hypothetical protein
MSSEPVRGEAGQGQTGLLTPARAAWAHSPYTLS